MSETTLINLVNPEFDIAYGGQTYRVRKASLDKVVQYTKRVKELQANKDGEGDYKILAYCFYLVLKDKIADLTEQQVIENVPGDLDIQETLVTLGFINPKKMEELKKVQAQVMNRLTTENSSQSSPKEQDGAQTS